MRRLGLNLKRGKIVYMPYQKNYILCLLKPYMVLIFFVNNFLLTFSLFGAKARGILAPLSNYIQPSVIKAYTDHTFP